MAEYTSYLGLKKPAQHENYNVEDFNDNADLIDAKMEEQADGIGALQQTVVAHLAEDAPHGIGDKSTLLTTEKSTIVGAVNELFTDVSNGKNTIASAITDMGQAASGSDTFAQLAAKIRDISDDANAGVEDVLNGKTFYQGGVKRTGTLNPSNIENIQHGLASFAASGPLYIDVPISSVDVNRTAVIVYSTSASSDAAYHHARGKLTSPTNLRLETNGVTWGFNCAWQVIQFVGIKSFQKGSLTPAATPITVGINSINPSKAMVVMNFTPCGQTSNLWWGRIVNGNTIEFGCSYQRPDLVSYINWYVIEFN